MKCRTEVWGGDQSKNRRHGLGRHTGKRTGIRILLRPEKCGCKDGLVVALMAGRVIHFFSSTFIEPVLCVKCYARSRGYLGE